MKAYDIIIIGAGAAGLTAAGAITSRSQHVAVLDMGSAPARKVLVSGGGRCNFTNLAVKYDRYFGENPDFVHSALARVTPSDILNWATEHHIEFTEKSPGQYFTSVGANAVRDALLDDAKGVQIISNQIVESVTRSNNLFNITTQNAKYTAKSVIVATGGTSFATLGVSDVGYKIAKFFGHKIIPVRPALCAIAIKDWTGKLAGISVPVRITVGKQIIDDALLFTHFGIGGPAIYRTTVRDISTGFNIDFMPSKNAFEILCAAKHTRGRTKIATVLGDFMPIKLARFFVNQNDKNIADCKDSELQNIALKIQNFHLSANDIKLHNLQSAEVVRGGVSTQEISSKTMESKLCPGLFFAGEVLDIAGDLGGFNLHWAWASGHVAGDSATKRA